MQAMIRKELKDNRRNLLIWLGVMLGMIAIGAAEYSLVVMEAGEEIMELFQSLPRVLAIFFGAESESIPIITPIGYYIMMYLWYCIVAFTHAAVLGATIISKEERNRTAEFTFTKPFPRKDIITSKIIAALVNVVIMTLTALIGNFIMLAPQMENGNVSSEILKSILAMFFIQILFLFIGLLTSALFSSYSKALSVSAAFVGISYFLMVLIELVETIDYLSVFTPFMYFRGETLVQDGFSLFYTVITTLVILAASYLTFFRYKTRDLHS